MKVKDQIILDFHYFGYEDAKLGRKLSDADYYILSEAERYVQTYFDEINTLIDSNRTKLRSKKKILSIGSKEIDILKRNKNTQKKIDEIDEAINILNNEVSDIDKDIDSMNHLIAVEKKVEIEHLFGTLLYHYEKGYLTYKYEREKDQNSSNENIDISIFTRDIIDQYTRNLEIGKENLD